jgi:hypothetical protein
MASRLLCRLFAFLLVLPAGCCWWGPRCCRRCFPPETPATVSDVLNDANSVTAHGPGSYEAKVSQPVFFPFGYPVVPSLMFSIKVKIDGQSVDCPEIVCPETHPGYAEQVYVFRASKPGTYQVEITKVGLNHVESTPLQYELTITD